MQTLTPQDEEPYEPDLISSPLDTRVGGYDENGDPNWPVFDIDSHDEKLLTWFFKTDIGTYAFIGLVVLAGLALLGVVAFAFISTL